MTKKWLELCDACIFFKSLKGEFLGVLIGVSVVQGCHTDRIYLQPIREVKFLDNWKERFGNLTLGATTDQPQQGMSIPLILRLLI